MTKHLFFSFLLAFSLPLVAAADYKIEEVKLKMQPAVTRTMEGNPEHAGQLIAEAMGDVHSFMKDKNIEATGKPFVRTLSWTPTSWKLEAGLPVAKMPKATGKVHGVELPGGRALKTVHLGPQDTAKQAFSALGNEIRNRKLEKSGAHWVVFVSDPSVKKEEQQTEVYFPIK
jgi:effector-binding domain-containing protein